MNVFFQINLTFNIMSIYALFFLLFSGCVNVLQVITSRSKDGRASAVETYSYSAGLPVVHWPVEPQLLPPADLGVVVSFGHLLPSPLIQLFPLCVTVISINLVGIDL